MRYVAHIAVVGFLATIVACSSPADRGGVVTGNCVTLGGDRVAALVEEYPLELLSEDIRDDIEEALSGASRVCLVADGESVSCNAGGGPKPDVRRCCRFKAEPRAAIFGVARRIGVSREGKQVVDLAVDAGLTNASIDRQCDVPMCSDDRAAGAASLTLRGTVETEDGSVDFELPVALGGRLALTCEG